jgi:CRISPR type III-A-associated protein Csm2
MEDEQSQDTPSPVTQAQVTSVETAPVETQQAAPAQETPQEAPPEPTLAQALEIAKAKAEAESAKRDAAHQAAQAKLGDREPRGPRGDRPPRPGGENRGGGPRREGRPDRGPGGGREGGGPRHEGRHEGRAGGGGGRPFEGFAEIELEKLISDSLYLDNQAHAVVVRMRDMDSGTKSQLRRLYNAVRRAVRAPESERQHQFVMLRARLAYTIARHSLRSLDALERLLLQVTRRNDARGYERFKDLFEAIVAYNE